MQAVTLSYRQALSDLVGKCNSLKNCVTVWYDRQSNLSVYWECSDRMSVHEVPGAEQVFPAEVSFEIAPRSKDFRRMICQAVDTLGRSAAVEGGRRA